MRVWDLHPGYLNRPSLLAEHRELHGVIAILSGGLKGYSRHPETLRWKGHLGAARRRHAIVSAEMRLRGWRDLTPATHRGPFGAWPGTFIDTPGEQVRILAGKYAGREGGRIPLPRSGQEAWAHHKYSVMARDPAACSGIGRRVAAMRRGAAFDALMLELTLLLRKPPPAGRRRNALEHMWGYVSADPPTGGERTLAEIAARAKAVPRTYLLESTALSDLAAWEPGGWSRPWTMLEAPSRPNGRLGRSPGPREGHGPAHV